ncbi:MAG TPA: cephalosporin hydroxylase family protein [Victivallales bacterium]|nr:cephalosporin hydroxylase family protein [Victivallales bacterium]
MNDFKEFEDKSKENINAQSNDIELQKLSFDWFVKTCEYNYCFNNKWLGMPIVQTNQDIVALQEIIWNIKPELIIETGIARGGSLVFFASMLELLNRNGHVLGIDIDIRQHNRIAIENHPMFKNITMLEGSSIDEKIVEKVQCFAKDKQSILVSLDSNHTHAHVLRELELYAPLVTVGSYCVVFDTGIEHFPQEMYIDRPWGKGNNPKTAVLEFLKNRDDFMLDRDIENKLLITGARDGFLKKVK